MNRRVLVVEDDRDSNYLMCYLLRNYGHETFSAYEGAHGVELAERERPDVILMDLHMTPVGGLEAARRLEANTDLRCIPRIAVTAYATTDVRDEVLAAGFAGYISKPIDAMQFVGEVEKILSGSSTTSGTSPRSPTA
jgi:two-component system cell cycle response regulator